MNKWRNRERISGFGLFGVEFGTKNPGLSVHVEVGIYSHEIIWRVLRNHGNIVILLKL